MSATLTPIRPQHKSGQRGFSLLEVMVSMTILTVGLVALLGVFGLAMAATQSSDQNAIAKQLANEALESILTARETAKIPWSAIQNQGNGGIFLSGNQPIDCPGVDGIIGTADDAACGAQTLQQPGPDGIFGTADDVFLPLTNYTRKITITEATGPPPLNNPIPELNVVTITLNYTNPQIKSRQHYVLNTYVSEYR
ncbi:MAG: prepilin-type N-terminal cleavage/methylation domain-containing protein [Terriglobales bacterium]